MNEEHHSQISSQHDVIHASQVTLHWRIRVLCFLVGSLLAWAALNYFAAQGVAPDELALGNQNRSLIATYQNRQINAWRVEDFEGVYQLESESPAEHESLWLGNSQLHSVNQAAQSDTTAPHYASQTLHKPLYALSLPNANLQEHLVMLRWALTRRNIDSLILSLIYDDLREDSIREEFREITSDRLLQKLRTYPVGKRLALELEAMKRDQADVQGTIRTRRSLQDRTEGWLTDTLRRNWHLWDRRSEIYGAVWFQFYRLRNWVFGITPTTKRKMIPLRTQKNMAALQEILRVAQEAQIITVVYIVPLRWNPEPPYQINQYRQWKQGIASLCRQSGVTFADLDTVVSESDWGYMGKTLDFMHFTDRGHRVLAREVAALLRQAEQAQGASP